MAANARQSMRDRLREQAEKAVTGGAAYIKIPDGRKIKWFQPKEKDDGFLVDFVPYEVTVDNHPFGMKPGDLWAYRKFDVHYNVGAEQKTYVCLKSVGMGKCPICEMRADMANDPNLTKAEEKLLESLKPKTRMLFQLIDLDDEKGEIQLWDYSYHLFGKRLLVDINKTEHAATGGSRRARSGTAHAGFAELEGGQSLTLSFVSKTQGEKGKPFLDCDRIDAQDRQPYEEDILDETLDLDNILEVLSYDKLKAIALALPDDKEEKGEEPRGGRGRGRAADPEPEPEGRGRGRGRQADPEPEPEPEPPARGRRGRAADPEPEPEPENTGRGRGRGRAADPEPEPEPENTGRGRGRGRAADPEPEPEPENTGRGGRGRGRAAEPEPERPSRPGRPTRGGGDGDPECPAGGVFGKDCQSHDACYDCPDATWKACQDRQLELKKK